ncbi:jmjC domain-containing protein 4-like [Chenopodium quinoa]|uniref:jmjC domain-containing protein 4-like n=1 Tax=Chenopodium quinoa TaxID=63459 RepID=UPI000B76F3DA|nr:jmjC domain-containing protein 4-like [Chenopodium quinoa]
MDANELKKGLKIGGEIERVNGKELSYTDFVERYLAKNQPVVLTGLMDDWKACEDWVDDYGKPNLGFFSNQFGNSQVQIADCYSMEFTDQRREEMSVSEFIKYWAALNGDNSEVHHIVSTDGCSDKSFLYLKDWHFVKEYPEYKAYETPLFFNDDWLNLYLDQYRMHDDPDYQERNEICCSDYRFVYMGPKGTWTPLHADVFRSYSWSANVCGTKLWLFLPPAQRHLVFDRHFKSSVYNIFEDVNHSKFPGFKKAIWLECTQLKNEIIFVPSGWYHQVHNLEDAISINHNWFNGYNLDWVWDLLEGDYNEAKELIEDVRDICDDFESLCQRNLAANTGMNFIDFFTFIVRMSIANLLHLSNHAEGCNNDYTALFSWAEHTISNLMSIRRVASRMESTCLTEDKPALLDIQKIWRDPSFVQLYSALSRTFEKLHGQCSHKYEGEDALQNEIKHHDFIIATGSVVSNSRSLISLIDCNLKDYKLLSDKLLVDERQKKR